jgi:hypothetical protein
MHVSVGLGGFERVGNSRLGVPQQPAGGPGGDLDTFAW